MPYQAACIDDVFLLQWGVDITVEDVAAIKEELATHTDKTDGHVVFVGLVSDDAGIPSTSVRTAMSDGMSEMAKVCREMHVVIEGGGFEAAARRLVTSGISLVSGQKLKVHSTLEDALRGAGVTGGTKFSVLQAFKELNQQAAGAEAVSSNQQ